ncbi:ZYRO0A06666p [Zygosaccharomyces rouxii]|uniref:ZYRO0A06666p n=1 Tax=Zygosaccharomyces rouxii (strain ATCC 2623 / CBS 732 / NBRC 1130 / NCYC 568 / NRRL Y-229) TaxID=559307 RepID=C5DPW4_ZYGRC|nr:uncharacterized protein ZYRO0A06666g [Zygosaccharomyces rouxii]KAH9198754.1 oxidative stress survival, Svf1-like protein [Zygosaccharomyces rouxii]CAR25725.1 ZYRO0A06666p [Zygosaccharomyces rouxii]
MLKWIQGGISAVTGIAEPEYGSDYIHSVADRVKGKQPYKETSREDLYWLNPDYTNVETATFYFTNIKTGVLGFAQIIHSNIIGLHTQAQFTFRVYNAKEGKEALNLWTSTKLENFRIDGPNFYADNLSVELDQDSKTYHFKSDVNEKSKVDLTFTKLTPGCKVGDDPSTYYGDNIEEPWGRMRHVFWPRNKVTGKIDIKVPVKQQASEEHKDIKGEQTSQDTRQKDRESAEEKGTSEENEEEEEEEELEDLHIKFTDESPALSMFVMAFQGMKPHHAAKAWNFLYFHSEDHTAVLMEFITPKSYANTKVSVGIITSKNEVLSVSVNNDFRHLNSSVDSVGWNVPKNLSVKFNGFKSTAPDEKIAAITNSPTKQEKYDNDTQLHATVEGKLDQLVERIDVMNEIPNFVKSIVSGVAGTKPYIYQYADEFTLQFQDASKEKGLAWVEVTFISEGETVTDESYNEA